ncbi:hypothetical protein CDAR_320731 [Caerostris darwini]|uniref:Uncharacterized protein n=1 Tax=Caerostris darwini TaxID=1538125 RepID=A0AAV4WYV6_9ARAC|nr:hypothetical protein CDAR_320731 [Caerostris darwini]
MVELRALCTTGLGSNPDGTTKKPKLRIRPSEVRSKANWPFLPFPPAVGGECAAPLSSPQLFHGRRQGGEGGEPGTSLHSPYRFLKPPPGRRCVETGEASPFPGCVSAAFECSKLVRIF